MKVLTWDEAQALLQFHIYISLPNKIYKIMISDTTKLNAKSLRKPV